ncbi:MAG: glycosyltransferase family 39 protein [Lachnospiraceae bacterium]|nr:glycosyltransferase family 39 protein [Lachnospiraceae bacterium]
MNKIKKLEVAKLIKKHFGIVIFAFVMAVYYGWRMFTLEPWYDELYTYYSFISKGPVYAAIHWPVPNNHVMYSVVSAFLNILGNSYLSLRGISWLASVANLILLYCLANKFMNKILSLGCVAVYSSFYLVNYISIQGRGYTMAITFYLIAFLVLYQICVEKEDKLLYYVIFSLCLTWGLYTITSNVYWVLPICFCGGLYLLFQKEIKVLVHLIISSVIAAIHTFGLYSIIWLAIGSNLLSKTVDSGYYGIYQVNIILQAPFKALKTGMDYMLASPYVQSMDRKAMLSSFHFWAESLLNLFINNMGNVLIAFIFVAIVVSIILGKKMYDQNKEQRFFLFLCIGATLFFIPIILLVQSVQPYHRVFTFLGVILALFFFAVISQWVKGRGTWIVGIACIILCGWQLSSEYYNAPYASREVQIKEIWEQSGIEECPQNICFMDDYQKYVLQFYWDYRPAEAWQEEAKYILMPKEIMNPEYKAKVWPILYTYEEVNWESLKECSVVTETENYVLYTR